MYIRPFLVPQLIILFDPLKGRVTSWRAPDELFHVHHLFWESAAHFVDVSAQYNIEFDVKFFL
jgi:hypothetical protein